MICNNDLVYNNPNLKFGMSQHSTISTARRSVQCSKRISYRGYEGERERGQQKLHRKAKFTPTIATRWPSYVTGQNWTKIITPTWEQPVRRLAENKE